MRNGLQRQGVALALLAVLVGAIVQVAQGPDPFTLWQSMVGLIMVLTAHAYDREIATGWSSEAIAFAMIVAAGIVFVFGFLLDRLSLWSGVVQWGDAHREKFVSMPGFIGFRLHVSGAVFWFRYQRTSVPPAGS